jgi:SAM-dependent methyltransferase
MDGGAGAYVHGYSPREASRLGDQARTLADLLHHDTYYGAGETVLEVGCGVGSQTRILAVNSPGAHFIALDRSPSSLTTAAAALDRTCLGNVSFCAGDVHRLPLADRSVDHLFLCFVLEHLPYPLGVLRDLRRVLRPGGTVTVIEGDHGSTLFFPDSRAARAVINCLVELQAAAGGDALVGRQLHSLLVSAGYRDVRISPRLVYVDASRPEWVEGFTIRTFIAMVVSVRAEALAAGLVDEATWERGIADLYATTGEQGSFCYTFFKGTGRL